MFRKIVYYYQCLFFPVRSGQEQFCGGLQIFNSHFDIRENQFTKAAHDLASVRAVGYIFRLS